MLSPSCRLVETHAVVPWVVRDPREDGPAGEANDGEGEPDGISQVCEALGLGLMPRPVAVAE
jgi:hypothetical protein